MALSDCCLVKSAGRRRRGARGGGGGGGEGGSPKKIIQSPDGQYKAPTDFTKTPNIIQRHKILNKSSNKYREPRDNTV